MLLWAYSNMADFFKEGIVLEFANFKAIRNRLIKKELPFIDISALEGIHSARSRLGTF